MTVLTQEDTDTKGGTMNALFTITAIILIAAFAWAVPSIIEANAEIDELERDYQYIVPRLNYSLPASDFIERIADECRIASDRNECVKMIYEDTKQANEFAQDANGNYNPYAITNEDLDKRLNDNVNGKYMSYIILSLIGGLCIMTILFAYHSTNRW